MYLRVCPKGRTSNTQGSVLLNKVKGISLNLDSPFPELDMAHELGHVKSKRLSLTNSEAFTEYLAQGDYTLLSEIEAWVIGLKSWPSLTPAQANYILTRGVGTYYRSYQTDIAKEFYAWFCQWIQQKVKENGQNE